MRIETDIGRVESPVERFFAYARERHTIHLKRSTTRRPPPWTSDPILQEYKFTNVFRELDRVTDWYRRSVRDKLSMDRRVLLATVVFRWFNRPEVGEALFLQGDLMSKQAAFFQFAEDGDVDHLRRAILAYCGKGPYVTGAYTINTIGAGIGKSKLEGVLALIDQWSKEHDWEQAAHAMLKRNWSMEEFCEWARGNCMGGFMCYEVACDLRWTTYLRQAPDILGWANPGPGALRGLNRVADRYTKSTQPDAHSIAEMVYLLRRSRQPELWPADWPRWEMREVEHTLCEFDKYERVRLGEGRPRSKFKPGGA